jgi:hypothetical protein
MVSSNTLPGLARGRSTDDDPINGHQELLFHNVFLFLELHCGDGTALSRAVLSKKSKNLREARGDPMAKIFERNGSLPAVTY